MDMSSFKVGRIDQTVKDLVKGYLNTIRLTLPLDNIYFDIPSLVYHWCLLYFWINEIFDSDACGSYFKLNDDKTKVTTMEDEDGIIFLRNIVYNGIHRWKFKLHFSDHHIYPTKINEIGI